MYYYCWYCYCFYCGLPPIAIALPIISNSIHAMPLIKPQVRQMTDCRECTRHLMRRKDELRDIGDSRICGILVGIAIAVTVGVNAIALPITSKSIQAMPLIST